MFELFEPAHSDHYDMFIHDFVSLFKHQRTNILPFAQETMSALKIHAVELEDIQSLGDAILTSCHPDSIITLKSWMSVTKTRYEEVSSLVTG